ncbi:MAG: hypothetical protein EXR67_05665 [Dehalococcoidia bacterium]|nr:hypothetical protein [Dehalococcoidia bacterium]
MSLKAITPSIRQGLTFGLIFALLSLIFSAFTFGRFPAARIAIPLPSVDLFVDVVMHMAAGALAVLPSRCASLVVGGGLAALLVDVDHIGRVLALPMPSRASHSLFFLLFAVVILALLARTKWFPVKEHWLLVGATAAAAVLSHFAVDAFFSDSAVRLLAPFSIATVPIPHVAGLACELGALALVWAARAWVDTRRHIVPGRPSP